MEPRHVRNEYWRCEHDMQMIKHDCNDDLMRESRRDEHPNGLDDRGCLSESSSDAARAPQGAVPQRQQAPLHLRMRLKPRRTSGECAYLERLPLPLDFETPSKDRQHISKARTRPSMWASLVMHARRSLPFLGGDALEGPLPPTPKSAVYNEHQIHQLGNSLLGFIPTALDAVQSNCWRKICVRSASNVTAADVQPHGGGGAAPGPTRPPSSPRAPSGTAVEAESHQDSIGSPVEHGKHFSSLCTRTNQEERATTSKWRSRRVMFDAPDLAALLSECLRRRLSAVALLLLSSVFSLLLLYYSLAAFLYPATEAIARNAQRVVEIDTKTLGAGFRGSPAEPHTLYASSVQLQRDLQNLRLQMREELKDLKNYRKQLQMELKSDSGAFQTRGKNPQYGGHSLIVHGKGPKARESAYPVGRKDCKMQVDEGWKESILALKAQVKDLFQNDARIIADVEGLRKRVEEASAQYGASRILETEQLLKEVHSILNEDDRIDWALESLGASIVMSETVSSLAHSTLSWGSTISSYLEDLVENEQQAGIGGGAGRVVKKPNVVLQPDTHPGNCYPFYGDKGNVTILLPTAIFVTSVAVDGVASKQFTASTPRRFTLWGYEDPRATSAIHGSVLQSHDTITPGRADEKCSDPRRSDVCGTVYAKVASTQQMSTPVLSWWGTGKKMLQWIFLLLKSPARLRQQWDSGHVSGRKFRKVHLGDYELRKPQKLSVFQVQKKHHTPVRKITFEFLSNFGHPYTCIYRLRVHGDKGKPSPLLLPSKNG